MTRHLKFLALSALTALALAVNPAPAQPPPGDPEGGKVPDADKLERIEKQLDALNKHLKKAFDNLGVDMKGVKDEINALKESDADTTVKLRDATMKIGALEKVVNQLRLDIETLQKRVSPRESFYPDDKGALEEIRARLSQIERMLSRLETTSKRIPDSSPNGGTGRLVLVNQFSDTVLFVINQKPVRVLPGQTAVVDNQPAGVFTFEAISESAGSRGRFTRVLAAGETYTLTARP
jgi:hypothetical protein